jgi:hypothetical protein
MNKEKEIIERLLCEEQVSIALKIASIANTDENIGDYRETISTLQYVLSRGKIGEDYGQTWVKEKDFEYLKCNECNNLTYECKEDIEEGCTPLCHNCSG